MTVCQNHDLFMSALAKQVLSIFEGDDGSIAFPTEQKITWLGSASHKDHLIEASRQQFASEVAGRCRPHRQGHAVVRDFEGAIGGEKDPQAGHDLRAGERA